MADAPKRGRGRPRREGADAEILGVALSLLREKGYRDLTVDAVAERSGLAKTTIYRRWPTKAALAAAALAPLVTTAPPPAKSLDEELTILLTRLATLLSGDLGPIITGLAAEGDVDFLMPRQRFRDALARGAARGELAPDVDHELLIDMAVGPLWTRLLITRQPIPNELAVAIASRLVGSSR